MLLADKVSRWFLSEGDEHGTLLIRVLAAPVYMKEHCQRDGTSKAMREA